MGEKSMKRLKKRCLSGEMARENPCQMKEFFLDRLYFRFIIFFQVMGSFFSTQMLSLIFARWP